MPIAISLSPTIEADDRRLVWRTLLSPRRAGATIETCRDIERALTRQLAGRPAVLTNSGRGALLYALRALGIGDGDDVMIQAFTCLAVPAAVRWAGATPVYADIDPVTYNLDPASVRARITARTRALVIQHTFGIPAAVDELIAIAREHSLVVIEDLAHGLGGTYRGQPLGTFGDVAILSFGRDKTLSCVFGGAIVARDAAVAAKVRATVLALPLPPRWWVLQQLFHPLFLSVVVPLYFMAGLGKFLLVAAQKLNLLSKAVSRVERQGQQPRFIGWQFSPHLAPLLQLQLTKLPRFTARRRALAARYAAALAVPPLLSSLLSTGSWLRFPLSVRTPRATLLAARRAQILLGDWYDHPVTPADTATEAVTGYTPGSCPQAEAAAQTVINLPTYPRLTDADVERVISFIKTHDVI